MVARFQLGSELVESTLGSVASAAVFQLIIIGGGVHDSLTRWHTPDVCSGALVSGKDCVYTSCTASDCNYTVALQSPGIITLQVIVWSTWHCMLATTKGHLHCHRI